MDIQTKSRVEEARDTFLESLDRLRPDTFTGTAFADCRTDPDVNDETGLPGLIVCTDWNEVCVLCGNHQTACAAEQKKLVLDYGPSLADRDRLVCMQAVRCLQDTKWSKKTTLELKDALEAGELKDEDYAESMLKAIRPKLFAHKYMGDLHRAASDSSACFGRFKELEEFCESNGICYDRRSDSFCDYDAELVQSRPGVHEHYDTGTSGFPVWAWEEIEKALSDIDLSADTDREPMLECRDAAILRIVGERLRHDVVPVLTPLVFVDVYPKVAH